jgi:hypothetical protein
MTVLYALDSTTGDAVQVTNIYVSDMQGNSYDVKSNSVLGSQLGLTVGLLSMGAYRGETGALTIAAAVGEESLSVSFVEKRIAGPVVYSLSLKIAPEITQAGKLTFSKLGGPGLREIKVLIDRDGLQSAVYASAGEPLSQSEFQRRFGGEPPTPAGFPTPR